MWRHALPKHQSSRNEAIDRRLEFASDFRTTATNSAWENSRPIAAPICAISFAGPSRSSRAISEACRLAGTATDGDGTAARPSRFDLALGLQHRLGHFLYE